MIVPDFGQSSNSDDTVRVICGHDIDPGRATQGIPQMERRKGVQLVCCDDVDGRRCLVGDIGRSCRRQTGKGGRFFSEKTGSSTGDGADCPAARVAGKAMASTVPAHPTRRRSATGRKPDIDVVMRRRARRIGIILSQRLVPSLTIRYDFPRPECIGVSPPATERERSFDSDPQLFFPQDVIP